MEKENLKNIEKTPIDELISTEEDIIKLGEKISELLNLLKLALEGKNNCSDKCKSLLKDILFLIDKIKKNMHDSIDKVYSKKNFFILQNYQKN